MRSASCLVTCLFLLTLGACSGESTEEPADGTGGSATGGTGGSATGGAGGSATGGIGGSSTGGTGGATGGTGGATGGTGGATGGTGGATGGTGGSVTGGAGGSGTGGTGGAGDLVLGDCDNITVWCTNGVDCSATSLPGLSVCVTPPTYFDEPGCGPTPHPDGAGEIIPTCCTDADCTEGPGAGHCVYTEQVTGCCGTQGATHCVYDACASDASCGGDEICLPAGTRGLEANTCVPATCRDDSDCGDSQGGECRLLGRGLFVALVCTYPESVCRQDSECTTGPCGSDWCAPRWTSDSQGWVLSGDVECHEDDSCLPHP
jgi:hypothetical protein